MTILQPLQRIISFVGWADRAIAAINRDLVVNFSSGANFPAQVGELPQVGFKGGRRKVGNRKIRVGNNLLLFHVNQHEFSQLFIWHHLVDRLIFLGGCRMCHKVDFDVAH